MKFKAIIRKPSLYYLFFFIFLTLYYQIFYKSSLYYHFHQPIFLFDKTYFREFLGYPGGISEWAAQFFFQFLYIDIVGAILIALITIALFIAIHRVIVKSGSASLGLVLAMLPVSFLLIQQNSYHYPLIISVKFLLAVSLFLFYMKISSRFRLIPILLSIFIYYLLGGWIYLFWTVLCIIFELMFTQDTERYVFAGMLATFYLLVPLIAARFFFSMTLNEAYRYLTPAIFFFPPFQFTFSTSLYLMFAALPVLLIVLFIYRKFAGEKLSRLFKRLDKLPRWLNPVLQFVIVLLIGGWVLTISFDKVEQSKIRVDQLAEQEKWIDLLKVAVDIQKYDWMVNFQVNRALYHTGQLLDNLFAYWQIAGTDGLFVNRIIASQICVQASDLYFDLGHINASQELAYEAQTKFKYNPRILKRLAMTNLINGQYPASRMFLDLLEKSLVHRKWAQHYQKYLWNEALITDDDLIALKRLLQPKTDFFIMKDKPYYDLDMLLESNPYNHMALEYLLAYYMLDDKLKPFLERIKDLERFGYTKIPRHVEEVLLLTNILSPESININDYAINQTTIENFIRFNTILLENSANPKKAQSQLIKENLNNTYWYYLRYLNPKMSNLELKARSIDEREY